MVINFNIAGGNGGGGSTSTPVKTYYFLNVDVRSEDDKNEHNIEVFKLFDKTIQEGGNFQNFYIVSGNADNVTFPYYSILYIKSVSAEFFAEKSYRIIALLNTDERYRFIEFCLTSLGGVIKISQPYAETDAFVTGIFVQDYLPTSEVESSARYQMTGSNNTSIINVFGQNSTNNGIYLTVNNGFGNENSTNFAVNTIGIYGKDEHLYISFICDSFVYFFEVVPSSPVSGVLKFAKREAIYNSEIVYNTNVNSIWINRHLAGDETDSAITQITLSIGEKFYNKGNKQFVTFLSITKGIGNFDSYINIPAILYLDTISGGVGELMFYLEKDLYTYQLISTTTKPYLKFVSKVSLGANIYDLTDLTVEQETAIYNEMESASTWDNDASIYKYTGDGQFQMRYTDGTIINFDSFYWANRPARWVFNGSFTDNNGHAYNVKYGLYGDESSEPYVDYTPAVKFGNNALTYYTGNTAYNVVDSTDVKHVKVLTSAQYTALTSKDANTLYCIKG